MLSRRAVTALLLTLTIISLLPLSSVFAKETDAEMPLAGISASLQPDLFTGTLTGSIPIDVPPGRNGLQPNLALSYASSGGNSWTGMGWKLEMGTIERQTKWGVLYSPTAAEEQAGKVYTMRLNGISGDLVQDSVDPLLYRVKIEGSFARIKKLSADGTAGWEITDTKGTKYKFGTGVGTRIQSGTLIFKWCLERVEDRDGNYMTIAYQGDGTTNQGYLSQIDYTGNGATAPTNQVKFYLESRTDAPVMYSNNFPITTAKRVKTVEVKANGTLVRAYALAYSVSPTTARSVLASVKQHGKDASVDASGVITPGTSLPAMTFGYSADTQIFTDGTAWATGWCSGGTVTSGVDMNGDGMQDMVCIASGVISPLTSSGNGTFSSPGGCGNCALPFYGDFNGDGRTDISYMKAVFVEMRVYGPVFDVYWHVALTSATGTISTGSAWLGLCQCTPAVFGAMVPVVGDYNGDGKTDLAIKYGSTTTAYLSNGAGILSYAFNFSGCMNGTGDFNGDGKSDLWCRDGAGTISVATSTGSTFMGMGAWIPNWCASGQFGVADFNGDGKQDIYCHPTDGTTKVALSTGSLFVDGGNWVSSYNRGGSA